MQIRRYSYIEGPFVFFFGSLPYIRAKCKVIINRLMKFLFYSFNTLTFKIYKVTDSFNLTAQQHILTVIFNACMIAFIF